MYVTCTASQSSEKSREVLLAMSVIRTRKFALLKSPSAQERPHVSAAPPSMYVASLVVRVAVDFAAVHDTPPFHESWMQNFGAPEVLSTRPSARTSIPVIVAPAGILTL